jgi:hypothetical protein
MLRETCRAPFVQGGHGGVGKPPLSKGRCHGFAVTEGLFISEELDEGQSPSQLC